MHDHSPLTPALKSAARLALAEQQRYLRVCARYHQGVEDYDTYICAWKADARAAEQLLAALRSSAERQAVQVKNTGRAAAFKDWHWTLRIERAGTSGTNRNPPEIVIRATLLWKGRQISSVQWSQKQLASLAAAC